MKMALLLMIVFVFIAFIIGVYKLVGSVVNLIERKTKDEYQREHRD